MIFHRLPLFCLAAVCLAAGPLGAQTVFTFNRHDFGANGLPNSNLWTQPYTTGVNSGGQTIVTSYTNWDSGTGTFPNGANVTAIIGPQTDPGGTASLNGCHLEESVSFQNLTLTAGALLTIDDNNSGGAGNHAINVTVAAGGPGTFSNAGTINILGGGAAPVGVANALSIDGTGTLGIGFTGSMLTGPGTITQGTAHTLYGGGDAVLSAPFVNHGTINANGFGNSFQHTIFFFTSPTVVNTGTITATGSGYLSLGAGTVDNTGGLFFADGTGSPTGPALIEFNGGVAITGGTLSGNGTALDGPGTFKVTGAGASFTNVALATGTIMDVTCTLNVHGTITNDANITLNGGQSGTTGTLNAASDTTLTGTGSVGGGSNSAITVATGATLTNAAGHTIGANYSLSGAVNNAGLIVANSDNVTFNATTFNNTGTIRADGNGPSLVLNGGTYNNTGGTIFNNSANGFLTLTGGVVINGGSLGCVGTNAGNGQGIINMQGAATLANLTFTGGALQATRVLTLAGTVTNNGLIQVQFDTNGSGGTLGLAADATVTGTGTVFFIDTEVNATDANQAAVLTNGAGHTLGGRGSVHASVVNDGTFGSLGGDRYGSYGELSYDGATLLNRGTLEATRVTQFKQIPPSRLLNYDAATQTLTGGTYLANAGTDGANLYLNIGSVVTNAASVRYVGVNGYIYETYTTTDPFAAMADNQGSFALSGLRQFSNSGPLTSEGAMTFDAGCTFHTGGDYTGSPASTLAFVIGGTSNSGQASPGILQVNGNATVAGTLVLSFSTAIDVSFPAATDALTVLSSTSPLTGSFANVASGGRLNTTDGLGSFVVNYGPGSAKPNNVTLSDFGPAIAPTPTPTPTPTATPNPTPTPIPTPTPTPTTTPTPTPATGVRGIAITSPPDGITVVVGQAVPLAAFVDDPDSAITAVQFLVNGQVVGTTDGNGPFTATATAPAAGTYTLSAVASDAAGRTFSGTVHVTVIDADPANPAPTVDLLTPVNTRDIASDAQLTLTATADLPGTAALDRVSILVNGQVIATFDPLGNLITSAHGGGPGRPTRQASSNTPLSRLFSATYQMPGVDKLLTMIVTATDKLNRTSVSQVSSFHSKVTTNRAPRVAFANASALQRVLVGSVNPVNITGSDPDAGPSPSPNTNTSTRANTPVHRLDAASDATLAQLEYWINGQNVAKSAPLAAAAGSLSYSFTPPAIGKYVFHAVATDGSGLASVSDPVILEADAAPPVVTAAVSGDGLARLGVENGKVAVRRTGDLSLPLSVRYKVAGSALKGVNYKTGPLTGTAVIPAGAAQVKVKVKPLDTPTLPLGSLTVAKIKLLPSLDGAYSLGTPTVAKIKIIDNE